MDSRENTVNTSKYQPHKSSIFHINANIIAALTYWLHLLLLPIHFIGFFVGFIAPFFVMLAEKDSKFVKKHAKQTFILNLSTVAMILLLFFMSCFWSFLDSFGDPSAGQRYFWYWFLTSPFILLISLFFRIVGTIKAIRYKDWNVPIVSELFRKLCNNLAKEKTQ